MRGLFFKMEEKIQKILGGLEYSELLKLKKDVDSGAYLLKHLINQKINDVEISDRSMCASCNKLISREKEEIYTLLFGSNIKKKASFCGTDCLHSFLAEIRRDKEYLLRRSLEENKKNVNF